MPPCLSKEKKNRKTPVLVCGGFSRLGVKMDRSSVSGAAEAEVARGAVGGVRATGGDAVAVAVRVVAEVGAAAHAFGLSDGRARGICGCAVEVKGGAKPIATPFPHIAGDVVNAKFVGRKSRDGRSADVAVCFGIALGERALPDIAQVFAIGREVITPRVAGVLEAAARGKFPFGFCGQAFSGPVAIGDGIVPRDVDRRVVPAVLHLCSRAFGAVPARAFNGPPPRRVHDCLRDARCVFGGYEEVKDERPAKHFGFGFVRGCADEFGKFSVGDRAGVEIKGIDCDFSRRAFAVFGKAFAVICAH